MGLRRLGKLFWGRERTELLRGVWSELFENLKEVFDQFGRLLGG
jgi:hypothetical protein